MRKKHFTEISAHLRLLIGAASGVAAAALPLPLPPASRVLLGWCVAAAVFLVLAWWLAVEFDDKRTRARAQAQDSSARVLFLLMLAAVFGSVWAIVLLLQEADDLDGMQRTAHLVLSMAALAASWLLIQALYAFHYAHRYYQDEVRNGSDGPGLAFPGKQDPDYFDFMYFSHVIGMTSQVSDVQVTSRTMRRLTLVHGIVSFAFNMLVLALSINVIAGRI